MKGKQKCKILKEIRAEIARANDIEWVTENCTHKGDCRGTCPKCESEVLALERALARRKALGKTVAVVGLSAGIIATSTSCEAIEEYLGPATDGDMIAPEATSETDFTGLLGAHTETEPIVIDGDLAAYLSTDYAPCPTVPYRAIAEIMLIPFDDVEYTDEIAAFIEFGGEFTVIGMAEGSDESVMVRYKDQLYRVEAGYEELCENWLPDPVE